MKPEHQTPQPRLRVLSAVVGGSAIIAMGALTLALGGDDRAGTIVSEPGTYTQPVTSEMTTGETTKSTTEEPEPTLQSDATTTSPASASPEVTADPPEPPE